MILSLVFLFSSFTWSSVLMDEVLTLDRIEFSIKSACEDTFKNTFPLVEIKSGTQLDCMGTLLDVSTFCDKKMIREPYYIRAYIDQAQEKVICQTGKRVIFKYQCVKVTDKKICNDKPQEACEKFKLKLAKNLELVHFSQLKNEKGIPQVNCFYGISELEDKNISL